MAQEKQKLFECEAQVTGYLHYPNPDSCRNYFLEKLIFVNEVYSPPSTSSSSPPATPLSIDFLTWRFALFEKSCNTDLAVSAAAKFRAILSPYV